MNEQKMFNLLQEIWENISFDGDRKVYSEMLVLLDNIRYFLVNDLQVDYPKRMYDELDNTLTKSTNKTEYKF